MKKLLLTSLAAAALSLASLSASAATVGPTNFTVKVVLTPTCVASASNVAGVLDFGTYTAITGGASVAAPSFGYSLDCTRNLTVTPTLAFDAAGGGANGVVAGLNYTLSSTGPVVTAGTSATSAPVSGTASKYVFTVSGAMASNQAGDQAAAVTDTRTLTITY
jgi:hypothetical protein